MTLDVASFSDEKAGQSSGLKDLVLLQKLWPYIRPHRKLLLLSIALLIPVTLTQVALPGIIRQAVDGPIQTGNYAGLWQLCALYLGLMILHYALKYHVMVVSQTAGQRIIYDLRTGFYRHLQTLSPRFYHRTPIGKVVTRITNDVENLSEMFSSGGLSILLDVTLILGAIAAMFWYHPPLAGVSLVMLGVIFAVMEWLRRKSRNAYDDIRVKVATMNAFLQENFSGMEIVQLYRREAKNGRDFKTLNDTNLETNLSSVFYDSTLSAAVEFLTVMTTLLVLWIAGNAITDGQMSYGLLIAFFLYVQMIFEPIEDLAEKYTIIQSGLSSIDKIMALLTITPDIPPSAPLTVENSPPVAGRIDFDHVRFGYRPQNPVIRDISFSVRAGEKAAIIGPTGSGKSTLMKLLTRFYDVDGGRILLDGRDVREIPLDHLRRSIVVIQQDDFLFSRSIAENITLDEAEAKDPACEGRILDALRQIGALELIARMPQGIREVLYERGRNLSGGEKQILLFARAIYHNPAVLILDEATSAIDPHTEQHVQSAMERLMAGRTTLLIAHRLSTIEKADTILVIQNGELVESGPHRQLVKEGGLYSRFYQYHQTLEQTV